MNFLESVWVKDSVRVGGAYEWTVGVWFFGETGLKWGSFWTGLGGFWGLIWAFLSDFGEGSLGWFSCGFGRGLGDGKGLF